MNKSETHRAEYLFRVREYGDGTPWIYCELVRKPDLPCVGDAFLGFDLTPGTTFEQATAVAEFLNKHVQHVTHTHTA